MKIDFTINKMSGGGAERVVSTLANYLVKNNYNVRIITFQGSDKYELDKEVERIKLHKHPLFQSVVFNGFFSLLYFYFRKENRPDIISSHINLLGYMTIPVAKLYGIKIVVSEHMNHFHNRTTAKRLLWSLYYPFVNAVTVLTKYDLNYFSKKSGNVVVMPNPCSFEKINPHDNQTINRKKEILAVGNLNRFLHKGFDNLLLIASKVLREKENWKLRIIGDGERGHNLLRQQATELGIEEKVIFEGFNSDIRTIMASTEVFILSSRFEGLPMVLIEAMSQGMCCISYDCISGPSEIITDKFDGILVEDQNMDEMIAKLTQVINNDDLRQKLRDNAPKSVEKFSTLKIGQSWEKLFKNI